MHFLWYTESLQLPICSHRKGEVGTVHLPVCFVWNSEKFVLFHGLACLVLPQWGKGKRWCSFVSRKGTQSQMGGRRNAFSGNWMLSVMTWAIHAANKAPLHTPPHYKTTPSDPFPSLTLVLDLSPIHLYSIYSDLLCRSTIYVTVWYTFMLFQKKKGAFTSPSAPPCLWDGWMVS